MNLFEKLIIDTKIEQTSDTFGYQFFHHPSFSSVEKYKLTLKMLVLERIVLWFAHWRITKNTSNFEIPWCCNLFFPKKNKIPCLRFLIDR